MGSDPQNNSPQSQSPNLHDYQASSPIASWVFGGLILLFLMMVVFVPIEPTKFPIVRYLMALSAAFFAIFFVGGVLLKGTLNGLFISATGGFVLFILTAFVFDPFKVLPTASAVPSPSPVATVSNSTPNPTPTPKPSAITGRPARPVSHTSTGLGQTVASTPEPEPSRVPAPTPTRSAPTSTGSRADRQCDLATVRVVSTDGCDTSQCASSAHREVIPNALPGQSHEWSFGGRCLVCACNAK